MLATVSEAAAIVRRWSGDDGSLGSCDVVAPCLLLLASQKIARCDGCEPNKRSQKPGSFCNKSVGRLRERRSDRSLEEVRETTKRPPPKKETIPNKKGALATTNNIEKDHEPIWDATRDHPPAGGNRYESGTFC